MHRCIYCECEFNSRVQVKNPIACSNSECQKKRQRDNERDWHEKQRARFDGSYHQARRKARKAIILAMVQKIVKAIKIGFTLTGQELDSHLFQDFLEKALPALGLRRANKLWDAKTP